MEVMKLAKKNNAFNPLYHYLSAGISGIDMRTPEPVDPPKPPDPPAPPEPEVVEVEFTSLEQVGGIDGEADTTALSIGLNKAVPITADNIVLTGATKGQLSGSGSNYTLEISNLLGDNGTLIAVTFVGLDGYSITPDTKSVEIYKKVGPVIPLTTEVTFTFLGQIGGVDKKESTTSVSIRFNKPIPLTTDNVTLTGATKGEFTGSNYDYFLDISNITVENGEEITVTLTNPEGYSITPSTKSVVVYKYVEPPKHTVTYSYMNQPPLSNFVIPTPTDHLPGEIVTLSDLYISGQQFTVNNTLYTFTNYSIPHIDIADNQFTMPDYDVNILGVFTTTSI